MSDQPQDRIVEAALAGLRELTVESLLSSVGVRELCGRAGLSTGSLYRHVGSLAALADAVERHVYTLAPSLMSVTRPGITELTSSEFPLQVALDMHAADLPRLANDPHLRARVWVWALGGGRARQRYRDYLRELLRRLAELVEPMQSAWDREPRPPFGYLDHVAVIQAGAQGAALRQLLAPDPTLAEQYPRTQVAVSTVTLRRRGDHRDLAHHLVGMTYLPPGPDAGTQTSTSGTAASRILFSAGELFRLQGFDETLLSQIARRADVGLSTLHRHYAGKDAIALALLRSEARDLLPEVPAHEPSRLLRHLESVADFARPRLRYLTAYVAALLTGALPDDDPLVVGTSALLPHGAEDQLAHRLLLVLLQRLHHDPDLPASDLASYALGLLGLDVLPGTDPSASAVPTPTEDSGPITTW